MPRALGAGRLFCVGNNNAKERVVSNSISWLIVKSAIQPPSASVYTKEPPHTAWVPAANAQQVSGVRWAETLLPGAESCGRDMLSPAGDAGGLLYLVALTDDQIKLGCPRDAFWCCTNKRKWGLGVRWHSLDSLGHSLGQVERAEGR